MPQRNGQNPIRKINNYGHSTGHPDGASKGRSDGAGSTVVCHACNAEAPLRPGFRPSALKCPKCGTSLGKK